MTLVSTAPRRPPAAAIGHLTSDLPSALAAGYVEERGGLPGAALPWGDRVLDSPREPVDRLGVFADRFKRARLAPASDIGCSHR